MLPEPRITAESTDSNNRVICKMRDEERSVLGYGIRFDRFEDEDGYLVGFTEAHCLKASYSSSKTDFIFLDSDDVMMLENIVSMATRRRIREVDVSQALYEVHCGGDNTVYSSFTYYFGNNT